MNTFFLYFRMPGNPARKSRHFLDILFQLDGDVSDYGNDTDSDDDDEDDLYQPDQDPDESSGGLDDDWSDSDDVPLAALAGATDSGDMSADGDDNGYRWRRRNLI